jgi:hypothetical protein
MDSDALKLLYQGLDLPIILVVCVITQQVKHLFSDRWRPLVPLVLGMLAALAVQETHLTPFAATPWNYWRRMLTYGAGAAVLYSLHKAWLSKLLNGGDA